MFLSRRFNRGSSLLRGAFGLFCFAALPIASTAAHAASPPYAYTPQFQLDLSADFFSSETDPDFQHPSGQLSFAFYDLQANACPVDKTCLDLAVSNTTPTADANTTGVQSSRMVSAGFDIPGLFDLGSGTYTPPPPAFAGLQLVAYIPNTGASPGDLYAANPLNNRPGAFANLEVNAALPPLPDFDLCPGISNCLSSGSPNSGLANGDSTIVRLVFSSDGTSASSIADAFASYYEDVAARHTAGRWKAIDYCRAPGDCVEGASDKLAGGPPDPLSPPEDTPVPAPIPLLGAAMAFRSTRRLRQRLASPAAQRRSVA